MVYTDGIFGFHTVLLPNSPTCIVRSSGDISITSSTSYHPGGVQLALADGAVKFISEKIDAGTANSTPKDGPSQYGIWGALGSRDGGESISLP